MLEGWTRPIPTVFESQQIASANMLAWTYRARRPEVRAHGIVLDLDAWVTFFVLLKPHGRMNQCQSIAL